MTGFRSGLIARFRPLISRRRLIQSFIVATGLTSAGAYLIIDDTKINSTIKHLNLGYLSPSQATMLALLMLVIIDDVQFQNQQVMVKWLTKIDVAIAYLPDQQQQDLLLLLDSLGNKLGRLILTFRFSPWTQDDKQVIEQVLKEWRTSSLDILNTAYIGVKQLLMAVWYGEQENWSEINYPGPPALFRVKG